MSIINPNNPNNEHDYAGLQHNAGLNYISVNSASLNHFINAQDCIKRISNPFNTGAMKPGSYYFANDMVSALGTAIATLGAAGPWGVIVGGLVGTAVTILFDATENS